MAASWPLAKKTFSQIVNGITKLIAIIFNVAYDEIEAVQTYLGASGETQAKNAALNNLFRNMFNPLPKMTWIDADTIEIEAKTVVMYDTNDYVIKRNTSAIQITLSGNLDTGAEAASTLYYVYLCGDGAGTTYTAVFSASASAPTGYTYYKCIGTVRNDGSSNILEFYMEGNLYLYATNIAISTTVSTDFQDQDCSAYVPSWCRMVFAGIDNRSAGDRDAYYQPKGGTGYVTVRLANYQTTQIPIPVNSDRVWACKSALGTLYTRLYGYYMGGI